MYEWQDLQNDRNFFSRQVDLLSEFLPEICQEKIAEEIFLFPFHFDGWLGIRTRVSGLNKPTHNLLDYGNFPEGNAWMHINWWTWNRPCWHHIAVWSLQKSAKHLEKTLIIILENSVKVAPFCNPLKLKVSFLFFC